MRPTTRRALVALAGCVGLVELVRRHGGRAPEAAEGGLAAVEERQAAQRAALCSPANAAGVGLRGEYFAGDHCTGTPLLVRVDGAIDFDATLDWPVGKREPRPRSVRWSGWLKAPIGGRYRFHAGTGDTRVLVARQLLAGPAAPAQADIELAAGRFYPITVEANRLATLQGRIRLEWTAPHGARFAVPRALLYLPTDDSPRA